jgi:hypothetical protein
MNESAASGVVPVDLEVSRYRVYREDRLVQVWGWVGDYEVSVWLPDTDPRLARIVPPLGRKPRTGRSLRK